MNNFLRLLIFALYGGLTLPALFAVVYVLFPERVALIRIRTEAASRRALLLGLVNALFLGGLIVALASIGGDAAGILAAALLLLGLAGVTFGLSALSLTVGARLAPEASPLRQVVFGGGALFLACLAPLAGWFGLLPYLVSLGLGAFIMTLRGGAERAA